MQIAPAEFLSARAQKLRASLAARELDALLVTSLPNIAYLTGFFGSAGAVLISRDELVLIGDGRYASVIESRARHWPAITPVVLEQSSGYDEKVVEVLTRYAGSRVGFEAAHVSVHRHHSLSERLSHVAGWGGLSETDGLVEELRLVKDAWEVSRLRDGGARLSTVAKCILAKVLAGRTEAEVAADLEAGLRRAGFERTAFDTIVAAGPNAAMPHARASGRRIEAGELVVIDFGGVLDGYCTDLTRTVIAGTGAAGSPGERERQLIEQVAEAQLAAFRALRPGEQPEAADQAAREALARFGLGFTHGTGHGLGLEVHEGPRLARARAERAEPRLAAGMVVTLEPGVYFPGWGGVRIEDDVLITEGGAEWLTDVPRVLTSNA